MPIVQIAYCIIQNSIYFYIYKQPKEGLAKIQTGKKALNLTSKAHLRVPLKDWIFSLPDRVKTNFEFFYI